ncbi:MAG: ECF-type sigma factor [Arenimonas sp.]
MTRDDQEDSLIDISLPAELSSVQKPAFESLYLQLRKIARRELGGRPRTLLDTTALVNEAYLKIYGSKNAVEERDSFLALAAKAMRCVLIDHVRSNLADKRGGGQMHVTLTSHDIGDESHQQIDLLEIENGLKALEKLDPRLVTVVECHFFAGMEFLEIARHLKLTERTVQRDWRRARAFLQARIQQ